MGGFATLAAILFWQRRGDVMPLYVGMLLLFTALTYSGGSVSSWLRWAVVLYIPIAETLQVTFFYIFPNGQFIPRVARWGVLPFLLWRMYI